MAAQFAVAGVYVAGAALFAGVAWLVTPQGQKASQTLGSAVLEGGEQAIQNVRDLFDSDENTQVTPIATTNETTQRCDGPHRGRIQVQGYKKEVDPYLIELSWPWNRVCVPPFKSEGLAELSTNLLVKTQSISYRSAGYRKPAFVKMSQYIAKAPPMGFLVNNSIGWAINPVTGNAIPNLRAKAKGEKNTPRVDLEIKVGRAFGDSQ